MSSTRDVTLSGPKAPFGLVENHHWLQSRNSGEDKHYKISEIASLRFGM
jgi:hypothetical protein